MTTKAVAHALLRNAAKFLPEMRILRKSWGGPPGPRRTPSSRSRNNDISILQGASRPTGASAADRGVRPTINVRHYALLRTASSLPVSQFGAVLAPVHPCHA